MRSVCHKLSLSLLLLYPLVQYDAIHGHPGAQVKFWVQNQSGSLGHKILNLSPTKNDDSLSLILHMIRNRQQVCKTYRQSTVKFLAGLHTIKSKPKFNVSLIPKITTGVTYSQTYRSSHRLQFQLVTHR